MALKSGARQRKPRSTRQMDAAAKKARDNLGQLGDGWLEPQNEGEVTPMQVLLEAMRDPKTARKEKIDIAKILLPYFEPRKTAVRANETGGKEVKSMEDYLRDIEAWEKQQQDEDW